MHVDRPTATRWTRWVATFIGFPLAGVAARYVAGSIDSTTAGLLGGTVGGAVLGAVQATLGGLERCDWGRWISATAAGFGVGLAAGSTAVGFETGVTQLVVMGAVTGFAVGLAQAAAIPMTWSARLAWAGATPALWALGWLVTSQVIVDADRHHAVFGSSGALVVSLLAGALHTARAPRPTAQPGIARSVASVVTR